MSSRLNLRNPLVLTAIGVASTLVLAVAVVIALLLTDDAKAVSDNAALIGALVALGGVFTAQMVSIALDDRRAQEARNTERGQRQRELVLAEQRAQDEALQEFLDHMSQLLTDEARPLHRAQLGDSLSTVARARTLTVLTRLDGDRKGSVVRFLYESGLITKNRLILDLRSADLSRANLSGANLSGAYLRDATGVTKEQLGQARSLEGATMSSGQKYEDWLKSRGEENSGP